ncbi:uncharacterized protein V6R79_022005 [Siganus canaliculatus]
MSSLCRWLMTQDRFVSGLETFSTALHTGDVRGNKPPSRQPCSHDIADVKNWLQLLDLCPVTHTNLLQRFIRVCPEERRRSCSSFCSDKGRS